MSKCSVYTLRLFLLIICAVLVQLYLFDMKDVYHLDEFFSYGLANSNNGVYLFKDAIEIDNKLLSGSFFKDYLTQSPDFSFYKMWQNLKYDNHMPLYFIFLHFSSAMFQTDFSALPAIIVNVCVLIFLIYGFYKLSKSIFKNEEIALITTALFAFYEHVLGLEVFFRMYLLQMACSVFLLKQIFDFIFYNKNQTKHLFFITITSSLSMLTHFYSIVFCFFSTFAGFVILLQQKRLNDTFKFLLSMLVSVVIVYLIYPNMLSVGISGERGSQFISTLTQYLDKPLDMLKQQMPLLINPLFGNYGIAIASIILFTFVLFNANKKSVLSIEDKQIVLFFSLVFVLSSLSITLIMPNMTSFQIRYFAPIIPIFIIFIVWTAYYFIQFFNLKKIIIYYFLWLISFSCAFYEAYNQDNPFYFRNSSLNKKISNMVVASDVWWGHGGGNTYSWIIHNFVDKLMTADNIWTLVDYDNEEFKQFAEHGKNEKKYAYLLMPKTQEQQPQGAIDWVKNTTNRHSYYLFTIKNENTPALALETSVFLVCPY